jgi:hypothetical protein
VNTIEALSNEVQQLEQTLAQPDLDPTTEVAMRERHALSRPSSGTLAVSAPYAETSTEDLRTQLEELNWSGRSCSP